MYDEKNPIRNGSGYVDPTAYNAIRNIETTDMERVNKLMHTIFHVCELAGFYVDGRIALVDKKTGKVWR